jgi:hypothetical protein
MLAWKLIKLGNYRRAHSVLVDLQKNDLDEGTLASVQAAASCISHHNDVRWQTDSGRSTSNNLRESKKTHSRSSPEWTEPTYSIADTPPDVKKHSVPRPRDYKPTPPPFSADAILAGDLKHVSAADIIQLVNTSRLTGTIVFSSDIGVGAVYFYKGKITGAFSPQTPRLGELLELEGKIDSQSLLRARDSQHDEYPDMFLGSILVEKQLVSRNSVLEALERQVHSALKELLGWSQGRIAFSQDAITSQYVQSDLDIALDPLLELLEVAQQIDEGMR